MSKQLLGSILLAMFLVACSSKPMKDSSQPAVTDKSPASQPAAPADDGASTSGAMDSNVDGLSNALKDPNNILSKRSIYFDFDQYEVKSEFRPLIEAHAKYLMANSKAKVVLQGNADERGTREYNLSLGQRRGVAVKNMLNLLGVQDTQIETVSYGEEKANTSCPDESCWQQDRRVDIVYQGE